VEVTKLLKATRNAMAVALLMGQCRGFLAGLAIMYLTALLVNRRA